MIDVVILCKLKGIALRNLLPENREIPRLNINIKKMGLWLFWVYFSIFISNCHPRIGNCIYLATRKSTTLISPEITLNVYKHFNAFFILYEPWIIYYMGNMYLAGKSKKREQNQKSERLNPWQLWACCPPSSGSPSVRPSSQKASARSHPR